MTFGHSLIYVVKTSQLLAAVGRPVESFLLLPLARHLCYTTREDLIPEFKAYATAFEDLGRLGNSDETTLNADELFPASTQTALAWVSKNFGNHRPQTLYHVLLEALARNLLHFDTSYEAAFDRSVNDSVGWLDFTHGLTFANAVRVVCIKYPQFWPQGLLQMACMLGRNNRFVDADAEVSAWHVADSTAFFTAADGVILDHGFREPIFSSHLIKTTRAVHEESELAPATCRKYLLAGLNRFLHSPIKQKHTRRLARQAIDLVARDFA